MRFVLFILVVILIRELWYGVMFQTYLFLVLFPNLKHFLIREADAVHSLERVIVGVSQPVGCRVSRSSKSLNFSGICNMWSSTQIDQVATFVNSGASTVWNFGGQDFLLERVVGEKFQGLFFGDNHSFELLLLLDNFGYLGFYRFIYGRQE